jgi:signal transduction histidine kinase
LLDVERSEDGKFDIVHAPINLKDLLRQALTTVESLARKHRIKLASSVNVIDDILGDEERLRQVVINLLSNAIKFSPPESTVELRAHDVGNNEEKVIIEIADQGRGVPDELKNAIFERFRQAQVSDRRLASGAGLGLSIVKTIVEQHSGEVGVRDNDPTGSIFWFTVPKA